MKRSSQNSNRKMEYNDPQATVHIAVDVSKESLEILHPTLGLSQIKNGRPGILRWLRPLLKDDPNLLIVCEATGGYEKPSNSLKLNSKLSRRILPNSMRGLNAFVKSRPFPQKAHGISWPRCPNSAPCPIKKLLL